MYVGDSDQPLRPLKEVGYNQKHDGNIAASHATAGNRHSKHTKSKTHRSHNTTAAKPATAAAAAAEQAAADPNAPPPMPPDPDNPEEGGGQQAPVSQIPASRPDSRPRTMNEFEPEEPPDDFSLGVNKPNNRDILDHITFSILGFIIDIFTLKRIQFLIRVEFN